MKLKSTELAIKDFFFILFVWMRHHVFDPIFGMFETFAHQFQSYRKHKGGKWNLYCYGKRIYWSPQNLDSTVNFVDIMAELGQFVDVLKTEDWTNGRG